MKGSFVVRNRYGYEVANGFRNLQGKWWYIVPNVEFGMVSSEEEAKEKLIKILSN